MTAHTLQAALPMLVLGGAIVVILLVAAFARDSEPVATLSGVALLLALAVLPSALAAAPSPFTSLLVIDRLALLFIAVFLLAGVAVVQFCRAWCADRAGRSSELYVLVLLAVFGASVLAASNHFASLFLGLEVLSVALFALFAYPRQGRPLEAGIKYLVLSGVSSAFLLFGMALVYGATGSLDFDRLGPGVQADALGSVGLGLMLVGFGFKLAVVPFHMWTPDVFEGAPAPIAGLVATISKGAVLALLLRLFARLQIDQSATGTLALTAIAVLSILAGNLLALLQANVKRVLAYSSIAHVGYILIGLIALGTLGAEALAYYVVAYIVTLLMAFGVLAMLGGDGQSRERERIDDLRGLVSQHPWLAAAFIAALLSLAGIPLTMGFVGKFYLIAAGVQGDRWLPVIALIVGSAVGLFYYLRIINVICMAPAPTVGWPLHRVVGGSVAALAALSVALLALGIYPAPLIGWIRGALGAGFP
jgi:NADH-quinone oxidoreductase subunit N